MKERYSNNHPEIRSGEVFYCNAEIGKVSYIKINSKRVGVTAYNIYGGTLSGLVPVFISINDEAGLLIKGFEDIVKDVDTYCSQSRLCSRAISFLKANFKKSIHQHKE